MAHSGKDKQQEAPPARRNWAAPVSRDAGAVANAALARAGFSDPTLILRWEEIAGAEVAALARPLKLTEGPQGGVLTLKAEPGAAVSLQHETRALCQRINAFLGRPAIDRLRFVQGAITPRPKRRKVRPIETSVPADDPAVRYQGRDAVKEALLRLAKARGRAKSAD